MHIEFIQPYSLDLKIGAAINRSIAHLPPGTWVCHCDHDTLKPPGFADRLYKVLNSPFLKDRYVFTCRTNRVGWGSSLCVDGMFMEESISKHLGKAKELWTLYHETVMPTKVAPGYCMVFNKGFVESLGYFPEDTITFDKWLSGHGDPFVMEGLYIIHLYRWKHHNPGPFKDHLLRPGYYLE